MARGCGYCKFVFPDRCKHCEATVSTVYVIYSLGSIDVGDAYLMVEQEEPTVVEVDGAYYELGFTLSGSEDWIKRMVQQVERIPERVRHDK